MDSRARPLLGWERPWSRTEAKSGHTSSRRKEPTVQLWGQSEFKTCALGDLSGLVIVVVVIARVVVAPLILNGWHVVNVDNNTIGWNAQ